MSSNNVVWVMYHKKFWHVFYSGCFDNLPALPDYSDKWYKAFLFKKGALDYAHEVCEEIDEVARFEGYSGVEYGVCVLDGLAKCDKMVTRKDLEDFTNLLIKRIEKFERKFIATKDHYNMDTICDQLHELRRDIKFLKMGVVVKRSDGCYQFTYCSECLAYPMGLGCPNIVKGPVQLKKEDQ